MQYHECQLPVLFKKFWYKKKSKVHGTGLFASKYIPKGTTIIEYTGEKVKKKIGYKRADKHLPKVWVFELSHHYLIDGKFSRNHARLFNHSCNPNCDIKIKKDHIWIYAKKDINKNKELNYNYGYDYDRDDILDHPCKCGSPKCVGYIVDKSEWPKLKKYLTKSKKEHTV